MKWNVVAKFADEEYEVDGDDADEALDAAKRLALGMMEDGLLRPVFHLTERLDWDEPPDAAPEPA